MKNKQKSININEIKNTCNIVKIETSILNKIIIISSIDEKFILHFEQDDVILNELDLFHPKRQIEKINIALNNVLNGTYGDRDIIIPTNSPYIIRSVELFASRNKITDNILYYLLLEDGSLLNCTNDTEKIYEPLALPLEELTQEFYKEV